jgi:DNA repair exonuclease SbcCD ATPase subunit
LDLLKQTLSSLICPVCGDKASLGKISNYYKNKKCPYCGSEHYDNSLYDAIAQKIDASDEKVPKFEDEIKGIEKQIDLKYKELEEIEKSGNIGIISNPYALEYSKKYDSYDDENLKNDIDKKIEEFSNRFLNPLKSPPHNLPPHFFNLSPY